MLPMHKCSARRSCVYVRPQQKIDLIMIGVAVLIALAYSIEVHAQSAMSNGTHCTIPDVNFWALPDRESGAVEVEIDFLLLDIIEINDRLNRFTLDFGLTLRWKDSRLDEALSDSMGCTALLSEIWHPHLVFVNSRENDGDYDGVVEVLPGAIVQYSKRYTRDFSAQLDLRRFPFDTQVLTVTLASMLYGPDDLAFAASEHGSDLIAGLSIPGWRTGALSSAVPDAPIQTSAASYSSIVFSLPVERESGFYFWRLFFPLLLISLMAWSLFWLNPKQLGPQMTVATGAVFSMMALLISQGEILPAVSYLSTADKIIISALALVFSAFGESVVTGVLGQAGRVVQAQEIDRYARWVYLAAIVALFIAAT